MKRRKFMKVSAAASLAAGLPEFSLSKPQEKKADKRIAIQIGAVCFVDEGEKQVLDNVQNLAGVNTVFLPVFAYNKGLAGRAYLDDDKAFKGSTPDHGNINFDPDWFHGGYYATPHMKYYKNTVFKDLRAPEFGDYDMLASVIPEARNRNIKVYAMMADNFRADLPNAEALFQIDLNGEKRSTVCFNNPEFQGFVLGLVEDCVRSYDLDGLLWRSEKTGPLMNVLGLRPSGPRVPGCFCQFCQAKAKEDSINFERAVEGYSKLYAFTLNSLKEVRPTDGYYVTFWRTLLNYPEILQWQRLFTQSLRNTYKSIYRLVKSINPKLPVGWGFSSQQIYSHLFRADADIQALAEYTDFLKFYIYYKVGGSRMAKSIEGLGSTILADVPKEQLLQWLYKIMGYGKEGSFDELRSHGLSPDYVYRETKRALNGAAGTNTKM